MSDESNVYSHAGTWFKDHQTVNHSIKEYVRDEAYTNTVEGCFSILKRGIYGVYQHVSEAHLKRYLAEFSFRYTELPTAEHFNALKRLESSPETPLVVAM